MVKCNPVKHHCNYCAKMKFPSKFSSSSTDKITNLSWAQWLQLLFNQTNHYPMGQLGQQSSPRDSTVHRCIHPLYIKLCLKKKGSAVFSFGLKTILHTHTVVMIFRLPTLLNCTAQAMFFLLKRKLQRNFIQSVSKPNTPWIHTCNACCTGLVYCSIAVFVPDGLRLDRLIGYEGLSCRKWSHTEVSICRHDQIFSFFGAFLEMTYCLQNCSTHIWRGLIQSPLRGR